MGQRGKFFLRIEFQLINVEGIMVLENHHSAINTVIFFKQESPMNDKISGLKYNKI